MCFRGELHLASICLPGHQERALHCLNLRGLLFADIRQAVDFTPQMEVE